MSNFEHAMYWVCASALAVIISLCLCILAKNLDE